MANNVNANVNINVQGAQQNIQQVIQSLKQLQAQVQGMQGGVQILTPAQIAAGNQTLSALSRLGINFSQQNHRVLNHTQMAALTQALSVIARSGVNIANLSRTQGPSPSLPNNASAAQQIQNNLLAYLQRMGRLSPNAAARIQGWLGSGGNPLAPDFKQLFPNLNAAQLQTQINQYFHWLFKNLTIPSTNPRQPAGGGGNKDGKDKKKDDDDPSFLDQALKKYPILRRFVGVGAAAGFASSGLREAKAVAEAEDTLLRRTRDMGGGLRDLTKRLETTGVAFGQSAREALETAKVWSHASGVLDRGTLQDGVSSGIVHGYAGAVGFARAYGLDVNQTAHAMGTLERYGRGDGKRPAEDYGLSGGGANARKEFALMLAQVMRDTGMQGRADQVLSDLQQFISSEIRATGATPSREVTDSWIRNRALTYQTPALAGEEGQDMLARMSASFRSQGNMVKDIAFARALNAIGITDMATQNWIIGEGPDADLGKYGGPQGMTLRAAVMEQLNRDFQGIPDYYKAMGAQSLFGTQTPQEAAAWMRQGAGSADTQPGQYRKIVEELKKRGIKIGSIQDSAVQELANALTDDPETIRKKAARYAKEMNLMGTGGTDREKLAAAAADQNVSGEALRQMYLETVAKYGYQQTAWSNTQRADATVSNMQNAVGQIILPAVNDIKEGLASTARELAGGVDAVTEEIGKLAPEFNRATNAVKQFVSSVPGATPDPIVDWLANATGTPVRWWTNLFGTSAPGAPGGGAPAPGGTGAGPAPTPAPGGTGAGPAPTPAPGGTGAAPVDMGPGHPGWEAHLRALEDQYGLAPGTLLGIANAESDNRALGYHYPDGSGTAGPGRKKSTAYGVFGLLESTTRDPGYGVTPIPDITQASPGRQAQFSAEYLAALSRRFGGMEGALRAYRGEGPDADRRWYDEVYDAQNQAANAPPPAPEGQGLWGRVTDFVSDAWRNNRERLERQRAAGAEQRGRDQQGLTGAPPAPPPTPAPGGTGAGPAPTPDAPPAPGTPPAPVSDDALRGIWSRISDLSATDPEQAAALYWQFKAAVDADPNRKIAVDLGNGRSLDATLSDLDRQVQVGIAATRNHLGLPPLFGPGAAPRPNLGPQGAFMDDMSPYLDPPAGGRNGQGSQFGQLTVRIDHYNNNRLAATAARRLRAGSGVEIPAPNGYVNLMASA